MKLTPAKKNHFNASLELYTVFVVTFLGADDVCTWSNVAKKGVLLLITEHLLCFVEYVAVVLSNVLPLPCVIYSWG